MASTNPLKFEDPEKQALASVLSHSQTSPDSNDTPPSRAVDNIRPSKMSRFQHFFLCCTLLALLVLTFASASSNGARNSISLEEKLRFQELLNTVEPEALHDVLHKHMKGKYQHGVYQEDKTAMEVVHQSNAEVAQSLVELAKRQSNATTSTTPSVVSTPETSTPIVVQTTPATTTEAQTTEASTSAEQSNPASTTSPKTTAVVASTSTPTTESTPVTTKASSTEVTSSSGNNKPNTTPTSSRTQQIIYTTTLANGAATTVTSITVVPADQADNSGTAGSTKTTGSASLQTNGANAKNLGLTGVLGAIGMVVVGAL